MFSYLTNSLLGLCDKFDHKYCLFNRNTSEILLGEEKCRVPAAEVKSALIITSLTSSFFKKLLNDSGGKATQA